MGAPIVRTTELTLQQICDILEPDQAWVSNSHDGVVSLHFEGDDGNDYVEDIPEDSKFYTEFRFNEEDLAEIYIDFVPIDWPFEPKREETVFLEQVYEAILNGGDAD